jgi:hypothetical protein
MQFHSLTQKNTFAPVLAGYLLLHPPLDINKTYPPPPPPSFTKNNKYSNNKYYTSRLQIHFLKNFFVYCEYYAGFQFLKYAQSVCISNF